MLDRVKRDKNGHSEHDRAIFEAWLISHMSAGSNLHKLLFKHYDAPYEIYSADEEELGAIGLTDRQIEAFRDKSLTNAEKIVAFCERKSVEVINIFSEKYPDRLKNISNPPYALFVKGDVSLLSMPLCIAIVGTRSMSEYGMKMAYKISYELSAAGACVVSGMALGVDGVAAVGALEGGSGTVAVLGCGLDCVYPSAHRELMGAIAEKGALVSEYPPGVKPFGGNFPVRNRIISGLCQGSLIIEAGEDSGAMITARDATRQGRDVFALPGNIGAKNTAGTNQLIRDGARVVLSARDVLGEYRGLFKKSLSTERLAVAELSSDCDTAILSLYGVRSVSTHALPQANADLPEARSESSGESIRDRAKESAVGGSRKEECVESAKEAESAELEPVDDEEMLRILEAVKPGETVTPDSIGAMGLGGDDPMIPLSMLELMGYFESSPGGGFLRKK